ncbi:methyltransferase domain-containing protein [Gillisia sp. CAL575]|uniref:methyltransferase domain-containing protein n=1 Tax=Gillisia sp. CAL575 TaxID=985255 RepID=UPI00039FCA40|nr:methyltransferase domain-containing protein [Gillisia sp. CAL575]
MISINTSKRSEEAEIMDDFELKGEELEQTLTDLEKINKWLGGNKITLEGIRILLKDLPEKTTIRIADVGCGSGAVLREIANWGRNQKFDLELIGIDANPYAIEIARRRSDYYPEIKFETLNIFGEEYKKQEYDIVLCTLTLHHFKDEEILELLNILKDQSQLGVIINDLQRSKTAYVLFQAFCKVFISNEIARKDGLTSILRGFKKNDLKKLATEISAKEHYIKWKWAFRYRWILKK